MNQLDVRFNVLAPLGKLEERRGRRYDYHEIADIGQLSRQTVRNILRKPPEQVNVKTIAGFLIFFAHEGMPITVSDLFTVTTGEIIDIRNSK